MTDEPDLGQQPCFWKDVLLAEPGQKVQHHNCEWRFVGSNPTIQTFAREPGNEAGTALWIRVNGQDWRPTPIPSVQRKHWEQRKKRTDRLLALHDVIFGSCPAYNCSIVVLLDNYPYVSPETLQLCLKDFQRCSAMYKEAYTLQRSYDQPCALLWDLMLKKHRRRRAKRLQKAQLEMLKEARGS